LEIGKSRGSVAPEDLEIVLEFRILGPFEVVDQERPLRLGGPQQRALLAILVLHRGQVVSSDRLIDDLWGDRPPATAAKTVQGYVSHLRKALGDGVLATGGGGYRLSADMVDAERFEAMVADGRRVLAEGDPASARERLGAALALWRGEALADLAYEPFAHAEVARLEDARLDAVEDRVEADLALGRHRAMVGELEALVAAHPNRERLLGELMLALYRSGRQTDALEAYRSGRQALQEELGLEPGPELRALEQRILDHDPALAPPVAVRRATRRPRGRLLVAIGGALVLAAAIAAAAIELVGGASRAAWAAANSVAAIDVRTNHVVADVPVGARPSGVAFGSGSLWVANLDDQNVSRVNPRSLRTLRTFSVGAPPTGIAAAGDRVWVVGPDGAAPAVSVRSIDPQFDALGRSVRLSNVVAGSPGALATSAGALWVAPYWGAVARLDPRTGRVISERDPNTAASGIAVGAGAAWITNSDADNITRVDATGLPRPVAVGHGPRGIAVGEGSVWVADSGDDEVRRIDPDTTAVTAIIPVGRAPAGVALGAGSVWVANSGDGTVTRIDPGTAKPIATIPVGGSPQALVVARGQVWVTVDARALPGAGGGTARLVSRYDPGPLDPAVSPSWTLLYATCAKLLNYPDKAGQAGSQLVPEVAQALPARSADGRSYTFTIRPGFRFSPPSNQPVTPQTFKDSIERSLNPRMHSPLARDFRDIVGAGAYMAGKAAHIAGVTVHGNKLTIRTTAAAPDLPARTTEPAFCAVPPDTPINPDGTRGIPSAGPYRVASYDPGQGVVLTRNPNYHGSRPHRLARIELTFGVPARRAVAQVEAGTADYGMDGPADRAEAARLTARYGATGGGHPRYFVTPAPQLDFLALNTHRPLFADVRLRRAVNNAIDRTALAGLGDEYSPLPERPTDHYLPPGMPGYRDTRIYPLRPDLRKAKRLARGHAGATAVLYTCDVAPCDQQAQIIKTDLAAIGLRVEVKRFPDATMLVKLARPGAFDMAWIGWLPNYMDPTAFLNYLLESGTVLPTLRDPADRARLATAARLSGARRYLTYGRLDAELARRAAPLVAFGNLSYHELFSARIGCEIAQPVYEVDLAALCLRRSG
jgi:YVTN family beta-propeller protein